MINDHREIARGAVFQGLLIGGCPKLPGVTSPPSPIQLRMAGAQPNQPQMAQPNVVQRQTIHGHVHQQVNCGVTGCIPRRALPTPNAQGRSANPHINQHSAHLQRNVQAKMAHPNVAQPRAAHHQPVPPQAEHRRAMSPRNATLGRPTVQQHATGGGQISAPGTQGVMQAKYQSSGITPKQNVTSSATTGVRPIKRPMPGTKASVVQAARIPTWNKQRTINRPTPKPVKQWRPKPDRPVYRASTHQTLRKPNMDFSTVPPKKSKTPNKASSNVATVPTSTNTVRDFVRDNVIAPVNAVAGYSVNEIIDFVLNNAGFNVESGIGSVDQAVEDMLKLQRISEVLTKEYGLQGDDYMTAMQTIIEKMWGPQLGNMLTQK